MVTDDEGEPARRSLASFVPSAGVRNAASLVEAFWLTTRGPMVHLLAMAVLAHASRRPHQVSALGWGGPRTLQ